MYQYRPSRAESLYRLADHYQRTGNPVLGYIVARYALSIPISEDIIFVERWVYEYGIRLVAARCSHALNFREETVKTCETLLSHEALPNEIRKEVQSIYDSVNSSNVNITKSSPL